MIRLDEFGESLLRIAQETLLVIDRDGKVLKANPKANEILRPFGGELEGMHIFDLFSATSAADLAVLIQDALAGAGIEARSMRLEPQNMDELFLDINAAPLEAGEEGPLLIISMQDITRSRDLEDKLRNYSEDLHKRVEERTAELEEAKEKYRSLFEKASVPLAWLNTKGVLQSANQPFYSMTGVDKTAEGSLYLVELIDDEAYGSRIARYMELLCKGFDAPSRFELEIKDAGGDILTTEWFMRFEPLTDQTLLCMIDITDRKAVENALRESEERYRKLVETSPDGVTVSDINGIIIMVNKRGVELYGARGEDEVTGKHILDFIAPKDRERAARYLEKFLEEGAVYSINYDVLRKDGTSYPADVSASVIRDAAGAPAAFLGVVRDISRREKAEKEIRKSENRYRTLFEYSREPVYVVTKSGILLDVNPALIEVSGYERHELIGMHVSELYHMPRDRQAFMKKIDNKGSVKDYELKLKKKGGEIADCLVTSSVQRDENGRVIAYQGTIRDITEHKKAEEVLRKNERRYRLLAENVRDVIWTADLDLSFTYVSPSIERMLGYPLEEVKHLTAKDMLTPDSYEYAMAEFKKDKEDIQKIKQDPDWHRVLDLEIRHKDGHTVWVETNISLLHDENGEPAGFLGVFRDIEERKRVQEALEESERYYRSLIENVNDIILTVDEDANIIFQSPSIQTVFGYRPEEVAGRNMFDFFHPSDVDESRRKFRKALANPGIAVANQARVRHKDGSWRYQESVTKNLLHDPAVRGVVINSRDVTESRLAEWTAREREDNIRIVLNSLPDTIIVVLDRQGRHQFVWACPEMEKRYSFNSEQITGKSFFELFRREEAQERLELVRQVFQSGESIKREYCVELSNRKFWHEITLSPLHNSAGEITAVVGCIHDISHDKELQETRRILEEQLVQAEKAAALGEMAAGVVHEINNPITGVNFYSQALENDENLPDYCRLRAGKIRESGERIKRLLQSLTSYSSAQGGRFEQVDVSRIIVQVKESLEHELEKRPGANLELSIEQNLPAIEGSAEQLFNLISNLAINALHSLPPQGGAVTMKAWREEEGVAVRVEDTGCGIDETDLPQIFDPFFSRKDKGEGTGLGLAIVKRIAGKHGASMDVESESGRGTTFTLVFPVDWQSEMTGSNGKD